MQYWSVTVRRNVKGFSFALIGTFLFLVLTYLGWARKPQRIQHIMQAAVLISLAFFLWRTIASHDASHLIVLLVWLGILIRFGYALYTPATLRAHDLGLVEERATAHAGYIIHVYLYGTLPSTNELQFAQPPLFYALSALWMKIYSFTTGITNLADLIDAARLTSLFASCATLLLCIPISREVGLRSKSQWAFLAICAFLPNHYLMAGRVNPDALALFFITWIVLYALRWYHNPQTRNTVLLALGFGFGFMTKMSVAVLAFPVGLLMLVQLAQQWRLKKHFSIFKQIALLLLIAAPLGLWHPIRNAILFAQPLGGIYALPFSSDQYIGNLSLWHRLGFFNPLQLFSPLYLDHTTASNAPLYLLKSAVFGEFSFDIDFLIPFGLLLSNLMLIMLSLVAMGIVIRHVLRQRDVIWGFILGVWFVTMVSYLWFILRYPFYCSMDIRYLLITVLIGALCIGKALQSDNIYPRFIPIYAKAVGFCLLLYSVFSVVMYLNIQ